MEPRAVWHRSMGQVNEASADQAGDGRGRGVT